MTGSDDAPGGRDRPGGFGPVPPERLRDPQAVLRAGWGWLMALGIALVIGGALAVGAPVVATIAVTLLVGATFLVGGAVQLFHLVSARGWQAGPWSALAGGVSVIGGLLLLFDPLAGMVALTLVMIASFFADGLFRVVMGLRMRPERGWGWIAAGGAATLVLALVMFALFPGISAGLLGLLAGLSLILQGWSFMFLALAARRIGEEADRA